MLKHSVHSKMPFPDADAHNQKSSSCCAGMNCNRTSISLWLDTCKHDSILSSLCNATYRMYNRNRAVSHGIQLVETTGLKTGWHQQDVAACSDAMRHAYTEAHPPTALVLPMLLHFSAHGMTSLCMIASAEAWQQANSGGPIDCLHRGCTV